jgi:hypothetical protein
MQAYDPRFHPPAPLAIVVVKSDQHGMVIEDVPMLLDTGADVSLFPRDQLARLLTPDARQYELESFDGSRSTAPLVNAELQLLG